MSLSADAERRIREEVRATVARDPDAALRLARQAHEAAATHKQQARRHDRRAAVQKVTFKAFKDTLEALGVAVVIEPSIHAIDSRLGGTNGHEGKDSA